MAFPPSISAWHRGGKAPRQAVLASFASQTGMEKYMTIVVATRSADVIMTNRGSHRKAALSHSCMCPFPFLMRAWPKSGYLSKQTGKARQAFMRSARQAGFFAQGNDQLGSGLLVLEQSPLARKVMGTNRTSQRKKVQEAMAVAAERSLRRSIQSSWGYWLAFQKLGMSGRRASERFGLSF